MKKKIHSTLFKNIIIFIIVSCAIPGGFWLLKQPSFISSVLGSIILVFTCVLTIFYIGDEIERLSGNED